MFAKCWYQTQEEGATTTGWDGNRGKNKQERKQQQEKANNNPQLH